MKKSFILYHDFEATLNELSDEQAGKLLRATFAYSARGEIVDYGELAVKFIMPAVRAQIDRDNEKYDKVCERNRKNGQLGGRKTETQSNPVGSSGVQTNPVGAGSHSDSHSDSLSHSDSESNNEKKESNTSCAHLSEAERSAPDEIAIEPAVFLLPLNTGDQYPITETALCQLETLYQAVNVREEFRKMLGWFIGNPTKRKTKKGIMRFVTSWLSKAQDRGGGMAQGQLRVNSVYQQKQVEGSQKAKLLNEIRRAEDEQRRNAEVATAGRLALPGEDGRGRDSGNGGPVDGCVIELQPAGD